MGVWCDSSGVSCVGGMLDDVYSLVNGKWWMAVNGAAVDE